MHKTAYKHVIYACGLLLSLVSAQVFARPCKGGQGFQVRVAVGEFGSTDTFATAYGGWNIGGGLAAQLITELVNTNQVIVVERAILSKIMMEQELGQSDLLAPFTTVQSGGLLGVDYLIVGEVTEFEDRQSGAGIAGSVLKGIAGKGSTQLSAAHVAIDMRIVDTRTGEIIESHRAEGRAWERSFGAKFDYAFIEFGGDLFYKTPLGKATRRTIVNALDFVLSAIHEEVKDFNFLGRIIDIDQNNVYVDAGQRAKLQPGDRLAISSITRLLTDPDTNAYLGMEEVALGDAVVERVETKYARARLVSNRPVQIGSIVRYADERSRTVGTPHSIGAYGLLE